MDSEDSRPGSSASNSSSSSSDSQPSSPLADEEQHEATHVGVKCATPPDGSPMSGSERLSRPRSRSEKSGSNSPSSSSSSDNEADKSKSPVSIGGRKASSDHSSSDGEGDENKRRIASPSPVKSLRSSRNSSISSNSSENSNNSGPDGDGDGGRERGDLDEDDDDKAPRRECDTNISNDLSDVSDLESEKHISSFNSKQSMDDEDGTNSNFALTTNDNSEAKGADSNLCNDANDGGDDDNDDGKLDDGATQPMTDLRQKLDQKKQQLKSKDFDDDQQPQGQQQTVNGSNGNGIVGEALDDLVKTHDEDALDFEAEEGECHEVPKLDDSLNSHKDAENSKADNAKDTKSDGEAEEGEELEEGEVSDEDEKRPEETEPKPVCRFYTRGQCTWGMSCRFLHPGVTDKGNYTMFDLVRPVPIPPPSGGGVGGGGAPPRGGSFSHPSVPVGDFHEYRTERPPLHHRGGGMHGAPAVFGGMGHHESRPLLPDGPVVVESAWERGLRTAKEMMRKANKRKEQDMDFEDKKMNLTLSPDELEKDPYFPKERASPPDVAPPYGRHGMYQEVVPPSIYDRIDDRYGRHGPPVAPYDEIDPYGRTTRYRELPPHRMPQYEDERRVRPTREVIVQRVEPIGRGDEWKDPWMRSKSPGGRGISRERGGDKRRREVRSYSSNSSYSSSTSSQTDSSSDSSRSPSPTTNHGRRYNRDTHKSSPPMRRHATKPSARSPSSLPRHSRHSPIGSRHSPLNKRRGHISPSPIIDKRGGGVGAYSPNNKRKRISPNSKKAINDKTKLKQHHHTSSSSGSGSSDSSDSDSDTGSSSSESSSQSRTRTPLHKRTRVPEKLHNDKMKITKRNEPPKKRSPISIEIKKQNIVGTSALASSPTHSVSSEKDTKKSRREELLKQLRAVEDAIAKKRSKLT